MLHVAVVDDSYEDISKISTFLKKIAKKENINTTITEFENALSFLVDFENNYDLIFLDIEMPSISGIEVARKIRKVDKNVAIIFVTNHTQYAISGYEIEAMDYILKPLDEYEFSLKMNRLLPRICSGINNSITIRDQEKTLVKVSLSDIYFFEVQGHYVIIHTAVGKFSEYTTLKKIEKELNNSSFVRCNRWYLVNLRWVEALGNDSVIVANSKLDISRSQKKLFLDAYAGYISGRGGMHV